MRPTNSTAILWILAGAGAGCGGGWGYDLRGCCAVCPVVRKISVSELMAASKVQPAMGSRGKLREFLQDMKPKLELRSVESVEIVR